MQLDGQMHWEKESETERRRRKRKEGGTEYRRIKTAGGKKGETNKKREDGIDSGGKTSRRWKIIRKKSDVKERFLSAAKRRL